MLPACDTPRNTEGYQGFFHLTDMKGDVSSASLSYIVRDHDAASYEARLQLLRHNTAILNERYGAGTVTLSLKEQYRNMAEKVLPHAFIIDIAKAAAEELGLTPTVCPIRGGTDGARLSGMIDLGDCGVADPWRDLSLAWRSLKHNSDGHYGKTYPAIDPDNLFRAAGVEKDAERLRYYLLLDELF